MPRTSTGDPPSNPDSEHIRTELERVLSEIRDRLESGPDTVLKEAEAMARTGLVYLNAYDQEAAEDCLHQVLEVYEKRKKGPPGAGRSIAVDEQRVTEYRLSFLRALTKYNAPVLKSLYAISSMQLEKTQEVSEIDRWMDAHNIRADWMREAAAKMLERLRSNSSLEHSRGLKVSFKAEWRPLFRFECRGYDPVFETTKTAEKRIKALIKVALESHLDDARDESLTNAKRERSRDDRPPHVRFKWLAMSLTRGETSQSIAKREEVDFSNISRGISRARKELGFPPHVRGRPRSTNI